MVTRKSDLQDEQNCYQAVIQNLHEKGLAPTAIHADMVATLGKAAPSDAAIKKVSGRDSLVQKSLPVKSCSGQPVTVQLPK